MTASTLATIYAVFCSLPLMMQLGVTLGAPWGKFTVGGKFPGRLPPRWRALALLQGIILTAMSLVVLDRGDVIDLDLPGAAFWPVLGMTGMTFLANAASPSRPERLLWTPVIAVMLASAIALAII